MNAINVEKKKNPKVVFGQVIEKGDDDNN